MLKIMKRSIVLSSLVVLLAASLASAQNEVDALRYSLHESPMTARSFGMGGAFGAVGADLSSFFSNPAGIGMYKRGGIELSLGLNDNASRSTYMGTPADNSATNFTLNNLGLIGSQKTQNKDWRSFNFGVAYSKVNSFYENISIHGKANTTLMYPFSLQADGILPTEVTSALPFTSGLAYETYTINPTDSLGTSYEPANTGIADQTKNIRRSGSQGETAFGFGANYRDFLYLGMSVNFQSIRFRERSTYSENFPSDQFISSFTYDETLYSDGTGVNLKLGAIIRPTKWLRAGVGYHTASRIALHETYSAEMSSTQSNGTQWNQMSPSLITEYTIRTPSKLLVNMAFVLGKAGVVSADYEYVNYKRIRMNGTSTNPYNYSAENDVINAIYRSTHKVRAGMEFRLLKHYYARAGAIYQQNPIQGNVDALNNPFITFTGGLGYRSDYFFIDFALGYTRSDASYYMYDPGFIDPATIQTTRVSSLLSVGFRY